MALSQTEWTGDWNGTTALGTSVSAYYNTVAGEIPLNETAGGYGWHNAGDEMSTKYVIKTTESAPSYAYVNGTRYSISGAAPFTIPGAPDGYVTIHYIPSSTSIRRDIRFTSIAGTNLVTKTMPFKLNHIDEIVTSLHTMQRYTLVPLTRLNISATELSAASFDLESSSHIIYQLYDDIADAIEVMYGKADITYTDIYASLTTAHFSADMIEAIRANLNYLETLDWDTILGL